MPRAQVRILKKKMQQIEALEARAAPLDPQQRSKVSAKPLLESALALLEAGAPLGEVQALLAAAKDGAKTPHVSLCRSRFEDLLSSTRVQDVMYTRQHRRCRVTTAFNFLGCGQLCAGGSVVFSTLWETSSQCEVEWCGWCRALPGGAAGHKLGQRRGHTQGGQAQQRPHSRRARLLRRAPLLQQPPAAAPGTPSCCL